jgi:Flp pilus assembly protein TadD
VSDGKKLPVLGSPSRDPLERLLAGDSAEVIASLVEHLGSEPSDDLAWLRLGTAYLHIGHTAEAAEALGRAVELDGDVLESRRLYASVLSRLRRVDEAAFQLVRAKRLAPDDPVVARELGATFYDKRLYDKALAELERARALDADDPRTHFALGLVHEAKQDPARSIAAHRQAVRLDPGFVEARRTLADALASMGELHGAVRELAEALAVDRANTQIAMNLEVLRDALRKLEGARLLGKDDAALERTAIVEHGQLKRRGKITAAGEPDVVRYGSDLVELWRTVGSEGTTRRLMLLLLDPKAAAEKSGDAFGVTVVSETGDHVIANFATAITVTFLREALGCPMTTASALYARALQGEEGVSWAGATLGFAEAELGDDTVHGLFVTL